MTEPSHAGLQDAYYNVVGRLTTSWAILEASIDQTMYAIFKHMGGHVIEDELQRSLERKLKYIKRCVTRLPNLSSFAPDACALMDEIARESEFRHDMIHGVIKELSVVDRTARLTRLLREKTGFTPKHVEVSISGILEGCNRAIALAIRTSQLGIDLHKTRSTT